MSQPPSAIDPDLLARLQRRDPDALRQVAEDLARPLYRAARGMGFSQSDARGSWITTPVDVERHVASNELGEAIRGCVDRLPDGLREVFVLRQMQDLDTAEICKILGRTVTHTGVQLHRACARLRSCLESKGWKDPE